VMTFSHSAYAEAPWSGSDVASALALAMNLRRNSGLSQIPLQ
jgi:hypothetical protein